MATVVRLLKDRDTGDKIYPVTNVNAVFNNDGDNLQELLDRAGRTFVVTLDDNLVADKTFTEIMTAYTAGKNIRVKYDNYDYIVQYESGNTDFYFTCTEGDDYCVRILHVDDSNFWEYNRYNYQDRLTFDLTPTANSDNPVVSKGIKSALDTKVDKVTSTDNAIVRFDGTSGDIQNSSAKVEDNGDISVRDVIVHGSYSGNDLRMITSSVPNNIYFRINNKAPFVVTDTEVRSSTASEVAGTINLGSTEAYWNNVYAKKYIVQNGTASQFLKADGSTTTPDSALSTTSNNVPTSKAVTEYITARGQNLVTNGFGTLGTAYNFPGFTFDPIDTIVGTAGSFSKAGKATLYMSEYMPYDAEQYYRLRLSLKTTKSVLTYVMWAIFDIDYNQIFAINYSFVNGSTTTLTQDLHDGDTVVHLADVSGFTGTASITQNFIFWDYTNSKGYTYPPETYSRNVQNFSKWSDINVAKNIEDNTITLRSPWDGGTHLAGTYVSQKNGGASGIYPWNGTIEPNEWVVIDKTIKKSYPGTAYVKLGWLLNYNNVADNTTYIAGISLTADASIKDLDNYTEKVSSTTDNAVVRFDGTTGSIQNSGVTIDDSNNISTSGNIGVKNIIVHGSNNTNDTRVITSDTSNNIYAKINGSASLVVSNTEVRRGATAPTINLGSSTYPWNNVYASGISGTKLTLPTKNTAYDSTSGVQFVDSNSTFRGKIGADSTGGIGVYAGDKIYLRPNGATSSAAGNGSLVIGNDGIAASEVITAEGFKKSGGTDSQFLVANGTVGEFYQMPTNSFISKAKLQQNLINNGLYSLNKRDGVTVTVTGFSNTSDANISNLFNCNYENGLQLDASNTGIILIEATSQEKILGTYSYGYTWLSFYKNAANDLPESATMRLYGNTSSGVRWVEFTPTTVDYCMRFYNQNVYDVTKIEITLTAKEDTKTWITQIEHQCTRGAASYMSAVTKYPIRQDLYGDVTAPKFIKRGGTSAQFLKADGSVDSNSYALASSIPTVNDATLTIQQDGVTKGTFTANASNNTTVNIDLSGKQDSLSSGLNIKTINGTSLLGSGNIDTNSPLVVTFTENNDTITCDTSIYSICDAHVAGKAVIGRDAAGCEYLLSVSLLHQLVVFTSTINASGLYRLISGLGGGSEGTEGDGWVAGNYTTILQQLVSGNNIKTVNSSSILGSGDLVLAGSDLNYTGSADSIVTPNSSINEAIEDLDTALHELGTPNEIASITATESLQSGGNNVVTITDTDGNSTSFNVKNGIDGQDGADGISLGEIGLVLTLGYDTDKVMSQYAVTKNINSLTAEDLSSIENMTIENADIPDTYIQLSYIDNGTAGSGASIDTGLLPDDNNWRFVGSWARTGTPSSSYAVIITAYTSETHNCYRICREGSNDAKVRYNGGQRANNSNVSSLSNSGTDVWHTYDLKYGSIKLDGATYPVGTTNGTTLTNNLIIGHINYPQKIGELKAYHNNVLVADLVPCKAPDGTVGMYDIIRRLFFGSINENAFTAGDPVIGSSKKLLNGTGLASLITLEKGDSLVKLMSQDAVTRELNICGYYIKKPSYFKGTLLKLALSEYPTLDIRLCDGVSVVMDGIQSSVGIACGYMALHGNTVNNDALYFAIQNRWNLHAAGIVKSYGSTIVLAAYANLTSVNTAFAHRVFTVDFKTGIFKIYKNGVLTNTLTPSSYDYSTLTTLFPSLTNLWLGTGLITSGCSSSGMAMFGHVLTDADITELYGAGVSSVTGKLLPDKWLANLIVPRIITNWGYLSTNCTVTDNISGGKVFTANSGVSYLRFGFTGIPLTGENAVRGNIIYEWDFEVLSGSATVNYSMGNGGSTYKSWIAIDEDGNLVVEESLFASGKTYHVINKPNNLANNYYDTAGSSLHLGYVFNNPSSDFSMWVKPQLKLTERGAAIVCSVDTYRKTAWEMPSGLILPNLNTGLYGVMGQNNSSVHLLVNYGGYKESCINYVSNAAVLFNGQLAVDVANGKIYVGYLTSNSTGVWKQINNN